MPIGVYSLYDGQILAMREGGQTLQEIGDSIGVTRERVRQILNSRWGRNPRLRTTTFCARSLGIKEITFRKKASQLGFTPVAHKRIRTWSIEALEAMACSLEGACPVCGTAILTIRQHKFCSIMCLRESRKYKIWPKEKKQAHRALVKRWAEAHVERRKEIGEKACAKWWRKERLTWRFEVLKSRVIPVGSIVSLDPDRMGHGFQMYVIWEGKSYCVQKRFVKRIASSN